MATKGNFKLTYGGLPFEVTWERGRFSGDPIVTGLLIGDKWLDPRSVLLPWAQVILNTALQRQMGKTNDATS